MSARRYMVCGRRVTVRESPEFYAQDVGVVAEGGVVRVFEEKEVWYMHTAAFRALKSDVMPILISQGCASRVVCMTSES